ncbi:MAG: hypothetical protein Q4D88_03810 [Anaerococcus sp.]|nr:hypothetical protein [Anaerococcus sp.]
MIKFIKYDLKTERKYFLNLIFLGFFLILGSFILSHSGFFLEILKQRQATDIILITSIVFLLGVNLIYLLKVTYKDFFAPRADFTFSLPLSSLDFVLGKVIEVSLFFVVSAGLFTINMKLLGFVIGTNFIFYLVNIFLLDLLGLLWTMFIFARMRFRARLSIGEILLAFVITFIPLIIITNYYGLVATSQGLVLVGNMGLSFIFPFAISGNNLYKVLSPMVYYFILILIMIGVDSKYIRDNINLI